MSADRSNTHLPRLAASLVVLVCLGGCGAPGPLITDPRSPGSADSIPSSVPDAYRVSPGDTLYSIAFRHGLDWRRVAGWNDLSAPYTIHVGDWIRLRPKPDMRPAVVTNTPSRPEPGPASKPEPKPETRPQPAPEASSPPRRPDPSPQQPTAKQTPPVPSPEPRPAAGAEAPDRFSGEERNVGGVAWRWPTEGRVARGFDAGASRKGILIAGESGQPVRAAADGEVVYSGSGLIGYGELIIVKHSDRMLSAYAHNRERLVNEGDRIRSGQMIARMGSNERDEQVLHFEIRRDGKPTDPVDFLPAR